MQAELDRLDDQLGRALSGPAWHGPSVMELLDGVRAREAAAHPTGTVIRFMFWERLRAPLRL